MLSVYLSSPVSFYQRDLNSSIAFLLRGNDYKVLLPQEITKKRLAHKSFDSYAYEKCIEMIEESNFGLLVFPYGRDCAWEVGFYEGLNKPLFAYIDKLSKENIERLRDWMVKGSIDEVITLNKEFFNVLENDPILKQESLHLINNQSELPEILNNLYKKYNELKTSYVGSGALVIKDNNILLIKEKKNSKQYLRRKGMWGFPTTTVTDLSPEEQSIISLQQEAKIKGANPRYISTKSIQNANGIFYYLDSQDEINESENIRWFNINRVLEDQNLYLRPTYREVLSDLLSKYSS